MCAAKDEQSACGATDVIGQETTVVTFIATTTMTTYVYKISHEPKDPSRQNRCNMYKLLIETKNQTQKKSGLHKHDQGNKTRAVG